MEWAGQSSETWRYEGRNWAPERGPVNQSRATGILPNLPAGDVHENVRAVAAQRGSLGFAVMLLLVSPLAVLDPVFDGVFLKSPDVP